MDNKSKEYTISWFIENYSYCWHKNGEELVSPEFTTDDLEGTAWTLGLFPRGYKEDDKGFISIFLNRTETDKGSEEIPLKFQLLILSADESVLRCQKFEYTFKKGRGYGYRQFLQIDDTLIRRKSEFLPQDTLNVRCKIWKGEGKILSKAQIFTRTRVGVEKFTYPHVTENFSTLAPHRKKTVPIRSSASMKRAFSSSLYITDSSCCDGKVIVEITPCYANPILSIFRISLLDASEKVVFLCEADNRLDATRKNIQKIILSLTRPVILNKKDEYLTDDKLTLLCECTFSTGVEFQKIENTVLEFSPVVSNLLMKNVRNEEQICSTELLFPCSSALDDLTNLYNNQLLTDVEIKTNTESFRAHKVVLCARSAVFSTMLTCDMKEKNTDCIQIDDLEDDTVQQLLLFLYSDHLENLVWESAIKLYYAGDKYVIQKLKVICASFFIKHLSTCNASELLLLADTYSDSDLKKSVEDFILKHEKQVFGSHEWKNLMKTHPMLVSETMCRKYV